jgi:eukaryotic-like serine/threonine-protein kinase
MTDFLSQLQRTVSASYDIERELSGGGMSRVFVATERALGRQVVIKVLPPDLAAGVNIERFKREIQLAAQLHHPHIVPLLSTGEGNGILYYTMPYIEGESLRIAVERHGRLSVPDVVRVLHDVVDALAYAHGRGVIHRDIKPANILRLGSHALVTDFGVAKALSAAMPISGVTTAGIAIGTPAYMAPEQLAGDPAADHRIDIYAVGLLAYELLIGSSPFSSSSPQATMAAQLTRTPEPLDEIRPEIPSELSDLIMRCLEKNPAFRPNTAVALQAELDAVSTPRGAVINSGETDFFAVQRQSTARGALMGAAVVVLASIATYAFVAFRDDGDARPADTVAVAAPAVATPPAPARASSRTASRPVDSASIAAAFSGASPSASSASGAGTTTSAAPPQPVVLSRADSLAIAEAVTARLEQERAAAGERDRAMLDSLRFAYERAFSDSIRRAIAAIQAQALAAADIGQRTRVETYRSSASMLPPPAPGERRVVVVPFSSATGGNRLSTTGTGDQIADSLRNSLRARGTMNVIDEEMTRDAARGGRVPTMIGAMLHAPAVVTGEYRRRGDSVVVRAQVTCLTCGGMGVREVVVPSAQATTAVPMLLESLLRDLGRVRWSTPTRGGSGSGRPPTAPPTQVVIPPPPPPPR